MRSTTASTPSVTPRTTNSRTRTTTNSTTSPTSDAAPAEPWRPDLLDGYERRDIPLASGLLPGETDLVATLVRRTLDADPQRDKRNRAVLSLPGWNDYFFHTHVADHLTAQGFTFYALDPRRSGRSLRDPTYRDYVTDVADIFEEIDAAYEVLSATHDSVTLMAHSTGGLGASLWAAQHPGRLAALVLNSPWIALWGPVGYSSVLLPSLRALSHRAPLTELRLPDQGGRYAACVHASGHGEWDYDLDLKAPGSVPIRVGWLRAILLGHRRVDRGLGIGVPVFMACSTRSYLKARGYSRRARTSDIVLDVENIAAKAPLLGGHVTLVRVEDGFHDLTLSVPEARAVYLAELSRWLGTYVPDAVAL